MKQQSHELIRKANEHADPTLVWAIVVGLAIAWIHIAPIAFNEGALSAVFRGSLYSVMARFTPYPQLYDDRVALYSSGLVNLALAFIVGLPFLVRRALTWWTVATLALSLFLGLVLVFVWVPRYMWLWIGLGTFFAVLSAAIAGNVDVKIFRRLAGPVHPLLASTTARYILSLLAIIQLFALIPAASGAFLATRPHDYRDVNLYFLLYMKDPTSPLHEEVVELVVATTDYYVVHVSDKVPQREESALSSSSTEATDADVIFDVKVPLPMLIARDSVDVMVLSIDPDVLIDSIQDVLSQFPVTTQPSYRVGRRGAAVLISAEYPQEEKDGEIQVDE